MAKLELMNEKYRKTKIDEAADDIIKSKGSSGRRKEEEAFPSLIDKQDVAK